MIKAELCVLGLGPAGRALVAAAIQQGIDTVAIDPAPTRRWRPTYAAWADELPTENAELWSGRSVIGARFSPAAYGHQSHRLDREYVVFDTASLQDSLPLDGARVVEGVATTVGQHQVDTRAGERVAAEVVIDARGAAVTSDRAQQTASGVIVARTVAEERLGGYWLMDWRPDYDADRAAPPSFLYAVALDDERMLLEETCLVGRPALGLRELRRRLELRLSHHGLRLIGDEPTEHVRFATEPDPLDLRGDRVLAIGARGGLMHPATGYSVATALTLGPALAAAIRAGHEPRSIAWPQGARAAYRLRRAGMRTLLALDADAIRTFFDAFFRLPVSRQYSYLCDRTDPRGTLAAMAGLARHLPPGLVGVAARETLRGGWSG